MALIGLVSRAAEDEDCNRIFGGPNGSCLCLGQLNRPVGIAGAWALAMATNHGKVHDGLIDAVNVVGVGKRVLSFDQFLSEVRVDPRSVPNTCFFHDGGPVHRFDCPTVNYREGRRDQKRQES